MAKGSFTKLTGGLAAGAGMMYFLDPHHGRRRRALLRDQFDHFRHLSSRAIDLGARDAAYRGLGIVSQAKSAFKKKEVDDTILVERIRSKLGRYISHPHAVCVSSRDGVCTLTGLILAHEVEPLLSAIKKVPGVREVKNELDPHRTEENISSLQGGRSKPGERPDFFQTNWAPGTRLVIGALCGGLGVAALGLLRKKSLLGLAIGTAADLGLLRAITNLETRRLLGLKGRQGVSVHKTIEISAPVERVFEFWSNIENYPRFMTEVKDVHITGDRTSHWVVRGPGGTRFSWDAEISRVVPNQVLAWRSTPGSMLKHAGQARFFQLGDQRSKVELDFTYSPPAGYLGHQLAKIFGANPKSHLEWALAQMKQLIEQGSVPRHTRVIH